MSSEEKDLTMSTSSSLRDIIIKVTPADSSYTRPSTSQSPSPPNKYNHRSAAKNRNKKTRECPIPNEDKTKKTQGFLAANEDTKQLKVSRNNIPPSSPPTTNIIMTKDKDFPKLESVARIQSIPLVESGIEIGGKIYKKVKESNRITNWYLSTAEASLLASLNLALPAVEIFKGPISKIDEVLCKSLDIVETRIPSITLPPQMMYSNAQDYMSSHFVKPVLKRADSVKQLGTAVLDSRVTCYAADQIDHVLDRADIYVDKYLPPDAQDDIDTVDSVKNGDSAGNNINNNTGRQKAVHTIQHANRFSHKLQRRLTKRTLQEARALKEQTTEAIHVLVYVAELVASDPKLAYQKAKELWTDLSKDEPENQAPPANLEQLVVLLTRESARRLVHLINFTTTTVYKIPRTSLKTIQTATHQFIDIADSMIKKVHLEATKDRVVTEALNYKSRIQVFVAEIQKLSTSLLEQLAMIIAGNSDRDLVKSTSRSHLRNNHINYTNNSINGVN